MLAWRSLSFFLACADVSILKACVLFAQSCLLRGMDEPQEEDPAFAPSLAWGPERRLTELARSKIGYTRAPWAWVVVGASPTPSTGQRLIAICKVV